MTTTMLRYTRDYTPAEPTPWRRNPPAPPWRAYGDGVEADIHYDDACHTVGRNMRFTNRTELVKHVREFVHTWGRPHGSILAVGVDKRGEFYVLLAPAHGGRTKCKVIIQDAL